MQLFRLETHMEIVPVTFDTPTAAVFSFEVAWWSQDTQLKMPYSETYTCHASNAFYRTVVLQNLGNFQSLITIEIRLT